MLKLETIKYKNFLSVGDIFVEIDLCCSQNTLVVGKNGNGKSSFLDAITFSLFGKPFRKINKPQLVNSVNKKDCIAKACLHILIQIFGP